MSGLGVFVTVEGQTRRPKSKKEVRELLAADPDKVTFERTAIFGMQPSGPASYFVVGAKLNFVGPDPYTSRKFYGTAELTKKGWVTK